MFLTRSKGLLKLTICGPRTLSASTHRDHHRSPLSALKGFEDGDEPYKEVGICCGRILTPRANDIFHRESGTGSLSFVSGKYISCGGLPTRAALCSRPRSIVWPSPSILKYPARNDVQRRLILQYHRIMQITLGLLASSLQRHDPFRRCSMECP